jgi:hypothetical protein
MAFRKSKITFFSVAKNGTERQKEMTSLSQLRHIV